MSFFRYPTSILLGIQVVDGVLSAARSSSVVSTKTGKEYKVKEVGLLTPSVHPVERLHPGQVGN